MTEDKQMRTNRKTVRKNRKGYKAFMCAVLAGAMIFGCSGVAFAADWYIDNGDITVEAGEGGHNVTQSGNTTWDDTEVVIKQNDQENATSNTVTVKGDGNNKAEVTLDGVNIEAEIGKAGVKVEGDADITLADGSENKVTGGSGAAGVEVEAGDSVTIRGEGSLEANGGLNGAGIGSGEREHAGDITIEGGTINANGGGYIQGNGGGGAGIGGGNNGHGGNIIIKNGDVTATGQGGGAGIGGGSNGYNASTGNGATVTVNDGKVNATGGNQGAGIGGGFQRTGDVTINGGDVTAQGGSTGGAGIGGGLYGWGDANTITITGGKIDATGGGSASLGGAGIGTGGRGSSVAGGTIIITGDAEITAQGGSGAAGIGGGDKQNSGTITIDDAAVSASGGNNGAGIGSGADGAVGVITINSGKINVAGGQGGAGVGGGARNQGGTVEIGENASVTAIAGTGAAGVGGGTYGKAGTIIIKQGAKVYAFSDGTKKWAIDIDNGTLSQIESILNGRFDGINNKGKVDDTTALPLGTEVTLNIVDTDGNVIDTITLPIFYENKVLKDENGKTIWDEDGNPKIEKIWHTYHSFALQLPDGEYYIQNSDNQYNNQFTNYPYDMADLSDRGMLFVVKDGQMLNYDEINWTDTNPLPVPEDPDPEDPDPEQPDVTPVEPIVPDNPDGGTITPVTPDTVTPVTPDAAIPVAQVLTDTPAAAGPQTVTIPEQQTPLASGTVQGQDNQDEVQIEDPQVPLAAGNDTLGNAHWALLNLILMLATAIVMIVLLVGYFTGKKHKDEQTQQEGKLKRRGIARLLSILPGVSALIAFLLTENMNLPMQLTDEWTLLMAVIAIVQAVIIFFTFKKHKDEETPVSETQKA